MKSGNTIRMRLTLLYGAIFLVSSVIVLAATFRTVDRALSETPRQVRDELGVPSRRPNGPGPQRGPLATMDRRELARQVQESVRDQALDRLLGRSLFVFGSAAVVALLAGWLVAKKALRPVHAITETARSLSETNLSSRIGHVGPDDELKELADTFDALIARLELAFENQKRFVASVSHELRSPLTILRARAETLTDENELRDVVVAQVERSDRLIEALLTLTRSESAFIATDEVDFAALVGDVLLKMSNVATEANLEFDFDIEDSFVKGDAVLLERLVGNLVGNAIQHNVVATPDHPGRIKIVVGGGNTAFLKIANDGREIAQDKVAILLEPFERGTPDRAISGHGIGLSVVSAIAKAHGAMLDLRAREHGGLEVSVTFPQVRTDSTNL